MPLYAIDGIAPELPPDDQCWIAPTAVLIGRVRLLKNASVWFGAVMRGDTDWLIVGENSNVQDNSVVHADPGQPTTIGANVTVGHNVILHSATIGDNSLIGMGSTLLNRCKIGRECIVGANALVTEGKEFPDGSMIVGAPARVVRTLDDKARQMILGGADIYVRRSQQYAKALKRIG